MRARGEGGGTLEEVNPHRIRTNAPVRKELGGALALLAGHFTTTTSCAACSTRIGEETAATVVAVTGTMALATLTHARCSTSRVRRVEVLPLSAQSGYEYRTLLLPVQTPEGDGQLPTVLVRLGVDNLPLTREDGQWRPSRSGRLEEAGFAPISDDLPSAAAPCRTEVRGDEVRLHLVEGQEVLVRDADLASAAHEAGAVLLVVMAAGSVEDVADADSLAQALYAGATRVALVHLDEDEEAGDQ